MKKFKRNLLMLALASALIAGCAGGGKNDSEEISEIDFLVSSSAASAENFIWNDILEEQFGLKANFEMAAQDAHLEKLKLLIALSLIHI